MLVKHNPTVREIHMLTNYPFPESFLVCLGKSDNHFFVSALIMLNLLQLALTPSSIHTFEWTTNRNSCKGRIILSKYSSAFATANHSVPKGVMNVTKAILIRFSSYFRYHVRYAYTDSHLQSHLSTLRTLG